MASVIVAISTGSEQLYLSHDGFAKEVNEAQTFKSCSAAATMLLKELKKGEHKLPLACGFYETALERTIVSPQL